MLEVMQRFKPEVVFHAAAYKHVPLMETNPLEACATTPSPRASPRRPPLLRGRGLVFVSTDKAVNPRTVMGARRRWRSGWSTRDAAIQTRFITVRFGNVLASGSVPIFRRHRARGRQR